MVCCKNLFRRTSSGSRSVICLKLVTPLRIFALVNIAANAIFTIWRSGKLSPILVLLSFIHIILCWIIVAECKRSVIYHREYSDSPEEESRRDKN